MSKFNENNIGKYTVKKDELKKPCMICKDNTQYIDYCCEVRICSEECYKKLTEYINHRL